MASEMVNFLKAQCLVLGESVQDPIAIHTGWLDVGHVDEMFGFLGANNVVVASPQKAYDIMNGIAAADRGGSVLFSKGGATKTGTVLSSVPTDSKLIVDQDLSGFTSTDWKYVRLYDGDGKGYVGRITTIGKDATTNQYYIIVDAVWQTGSTVLPPDSSHLGTGSYLWRFMTNSSMLESTWPAIDSTDPHPTKFVLVHDSCLGANGITPVVVTVQEVLADSELQKINLGSGGASICAKERIAGAKGVLTAAGVTSFKEVPVLFYGEDAANFDQLRSAVAFTPGLANCQPVGSSVYFPKPFGVFDKTGADLFEQSVNSVVSGAVFVDDWDNYHLLEGEVHCGSSVQRTPPADWWTKVK
jgi:Protein-arginine deiminase (PAD)